MYIFLVVHAGTTFVFWLHRGKSVFLHPLKCTYPLPSGFLIISRLIIGHLVRLPYFMPILLKRGLKIF